MRKAGMVLSTVFLAVFLASCGGSLPEVADEAAIQADLPSELVTVTIDGEAQTAQIEAFTIEARDTDLTKQTDDVTCAVTLSGEGFSLSYTCVLNYAYVRSTGWTIRDWEAADDAVLTLDEDFWAELLCTENLTLLTEAGCSDPTLTETAWSADGSSCSLTFTAAETGSFLTTVDIVSVVNTLTQTRSGFSYEWTQAVESGEQTRSVKLAGTVWHLFVESENLEIVFQIDAAEDSMLTFSGLIRSENLRGVVREQTLSETETEWSASEYGSITFALTEADGEMLYVHIQENAQWVTSGELYLAALEQETLPPSGELSDLMELEEDDFWSSLLPDTEDEETSEEDSEAEAADTQTQSGSPEPDTGDEETSPGDTLSDLWDQLQDFWSSLW